MNESGIPSVYIHVRTLLIRLLIFIRIQLVFQLLTCFISHSNIVLIINNNINKDINNDIKKYINNDSDSGCDSTFICSDRGRFIV